MGAARDCSQERVDQKGNDDIGGDLEVPAEELHPERERASRRPERPGLSQRSLVAEENGRQPHEDPEGEGGELQPSHREAVEHEHQRAQQAGLSAQAKSAQECVHEKAAEGQVENGGDSEAVPRAGEQKEQIGRIEDG